jgi:hypothetical protein
VLIVEESSKRQTLNREQQQALFGQDLRRSIKSMGGQFRILDQDATFGPESPEPQWFREALTLPRASLPWLVVAKGSSGESIPLPETQAEIQGEIEKYR